MTVKNQTSAPTGSRRSNVTVGGGLAGGFAAFLLTYMAMFLLKINTVSEALRSIGGFGQLDAAPPGDWQVIGWLFFEAHNVATSVGISMGSQSQSSAAELQSGPLWESWFLLLPIVVLLVVGYLVASIATSWDPVSGFQAGASVALGYALLVLVGVLAFGWSVSQSAVVVTVGPDMVTGIVLAGIVYPVIAGGIGGAIAGAANN